MFLLWWDTYSTHCPKKDTTPREEWAINKAQQHAQASASENKDNKSSAASTSGSKSNTSDEDQEDKPSGWSGLQLFNADIEDQMYLDTGSTMHLMKDKHLVANRRMAKQKLDMSTNAGRKLMEEEGDVPGLGTSWFDEEAVANIIGFAKLAKKYHIIYDNDIEDAFTIHMGDKIVKFKLNDNGLYSCTPEK